jgi:hypothetical protein
LFSPIQIDQAPTGIHIRKVTIKNKNTGSLYQDLSTHLVPPPWNVFVKRAFKKSVGEHYKGELIVGEDYMHLEL